MRARYLPECTAHTKVQHQHSKYALRSAAMIRAGVDPGLLDEGIWWQSDDLWVWALNALAVYVRVASIAPASLSAKCATGSRSVAGSISARRTEHRTTRQRAPNFTATHSRAGDM
jgi:hypothetical protein